MENQIEQIRQSRDFLVNLLGDGAEIINGAINSGDLGVKIKGHYLSGVADEITKPDVAVGKLYHDATKKRFPAWHVFIEDYPVSPNPSDFKEGDIGVFYDPLDGGKLLAEGKKGYSTMAGVCFYHQGKFAPTMGVINPMDSGTIWGFSFEGDRSGNVIEANVPSRKSMIFGRTPIERQGLLTPIAQLLGCEVKYSRGMAPQTQALLNGETDFFIYESGIGLSDVFPVVPIIESVGGSVVDLRGNNLCYHGSESDEGRIVDVRGKLGFKNGILAIRRGVDQNSILKNIEKLLN